jgi:hypothetical protein
LTDLTKFARPFAAKSQNSSSLAPNLVQKIWKFIGVACQYEIILKNWKYEKEKPDLNWIANHSSVSSCSRLCDSAKKTNPIL